VNADSARYVRITQRLALGVSSEDDVESQALAELLERRVVDSIALECAPLVTSDLLSERVLQAIAALEEHGVELAVADSGIAVERCFCESDACSHAGALLERLLGVAFESIITNEGWSALSAVGLIDAASYTEDASRNASRLRS
jgi:hypothetical protein